MNPGELIYFFLIGAVIVVAIILLWIICRKRKKLAVTLTVMLVIGYLGYYIYYPTLKMNTHAERYEKVTEYLADHYPDKEFDISPDHYEEGLQVGEFAVNHVETPTMGVILLVDKKGQVAQTGTWTNNGNPAQQELWREIEFFYGDPYTLDKENADITKDDEWIDGELTVFALTIDHTPALAIFNYSKEGYSLLELRQGERGDFVIVEEGGYVFSYADEHYQGETITADLENGEKYTLNVAQQKGRLLAEKQQP